MANSYENLTEMIVKSYETQLSLYRYRKYQLSQIQKHIHDLESTMYEVSSVAFDKMPGQHDADGYQRHLVSCITKKQELERRKRNIEKQIHNIELFLNSLNEEDRAFIDRTIIYKQNDTNERLAMRMELTEGGVRYKGKTIIRRYVREKLKVEKGGMIE